MIWLIGILLIVGIIVTVWSSKARAKNSNPEINYGPVKAFGVTLLSLGLVLTVFASFYTQDAGEAVVQRDITGNLVGQTSTTGLHFKAPWVATTSYDVRNNTVTYVGKGDEGDHSGGSANGPQITFQDREGVTGNLDLVVRYSLNPSSVLDIYREFQTQENFVNKVVTNDVRSVSRNVPANYSTIEVYNSRGDVESGIREALEDRWEDDGIIVEEVSLQEIRYSDDVKARFDEAQASRIAQSKAEADLEVAKVNAQQKVVEAKASADANAILSKSLTAAILQQRYIDALNKAGTVYVVPEGSSPLVQIPSNQK